MLLSVVLLDPANPPWTARSSCGVTIRALWAWLEVDQLPVEVCERRGPRAPAVRPRGADVTIVWVSRSAIGPAMQTPSRSDTEWICWEDWSPNRRRSLQ
jgi:hypothetical protein